MHTFGHMATSHSFGGSHNSRPTHGNAYSPDNFMTHMNAQGFAVRVPEGVNRAILGSITGGPVGAFTSGMESFALGFAGDAAWGFIEKAHECWL